MFQLPFKTPGEKPAHPLCSGKIAGAVGGSEPLGMFAAAIEQFRLLRDEPERWRTRRLGYPR